MRSFQFSDSKSHKFWTIDVSGSSFTVTYGKVGTAGQTQTKSFPSSEKAQAEADKLIREKTGKGYKETTPKAPLSDAEALERGIIEHADEYVRWAVYSDYLSEQGDIRGEFMQVQLELEDEKLSAADRKKLKKREADLLKKHEKEWLGPLADVLLAQEEGDVYLGRESVRRKPIIHRFERGWLASLDFAYEDSLEFFSTFNACKEARLIRELVINSSYEDRSDYFSRCPNLQSLRSLRIGPRVEVDDHGAQHFNNESRADFLLALVRQTQFL
jgi:uncharacterized protein (TIGR02996 family)